MQIDVGDGVEKIGTSWGTVGNLITNIEENLVSKANNSRGLEHGLASLANREEAYKSRQLENLEN